MKNITIFLLKKRSLQFFPIALEWFLLKAQTWRNLDKAFYKWEWRRNNIVNFTNPIWNCDFYVPWKRIWTLWFFLSSDALLFNATIRVLLSYNCYLIHLKLLSRPPLISNFNLALDRHEFLITRRSSRKQNRDRCFLRFRSRRGV